MSPLQKQIRAAVLRELLAEKAAHGTVSSKSVRDAAERVGVDRKTIRRWVERETHLPHRREAFRITDEDLVLLADLHGSISELHRRLEDGGRGVSYPTVWRAVRKRAEISRRDIAHMRGGRLADQRLKLRRVLEIPARNDQWQTDTKWLSVAARHPHTGEPVDLVACVFIDSHSRYVTGHAVALNNNSQLVMHALCRALRADGRFGPGGGRPRSLLYDNGSEFTSNATQHAFNVCIGPGNHGRLDDIGPDQAREDGDEVTTRHEPVEAFQWAYKGKIEAFNRTIEQMFSMFQPSWLHGPRRADSSLSFARRHLPTVDEVAAAFDAFIHRYNTEHRHSELDGRTPAEAWQDSNGAVVPFLPSEVLGLLPAQETVVEDRGVKYRTKWFFDKCLADKVGETVVIHTFPNEVIQVEVVYDGQWIGTARRRPDEQQIQEARELDAEPPVDDGRSTPGAIRCATNASLSMAPKPRPTCPKVMQSDLPSSQGCASAIPGTWPPRASPATPTSSALSGRATDASAPRRT